MHRRDAELVYGFASITIRTDPDAAASRQRHPARMYWDHMNGWGWAIMIVWSLVWIGFLGVIAWIAVQWGRGASRHVPPSEPSGTTARDVLDERFARGEIDLDEYQRRRQALERPPPIGVS